MVDEWRVRALSHEDISVIDSATLHDFVSTLNAELDSHVMAGIDYEDLDRTFRSVWAFHTEHLKLDAQSQQRSEPFVRLATARARSHDCYVMREH
jgi:hypothetical protein